MRKIILAVVACLGVHQLHLGAASAQDKPDDKVLQMDVKDFFNMYQDVFSAAMKNQKLRDTASAVYILDQDDIRRSGATSIPDLLRVVPGVQVARIGANGWSVSVRGGAVADESNSQLLVLLDGVSIVTPLFNGVFWEAYNLPLDVIERVEVIRGPGAAVWGNRAENGVINIITKNASKPSVTTVSVGGGNEHQISTYVRQGVKVGNASGVNVSVKYDRQDDSVDLDGNRLKDGGDIVSLTSRGDLKVDDKTSLRLLSYSWVRSEGLTLDVPAFNETLSERKEGVKDHIGSIFSSLWSKKLDENSEVTVDWSNFTERESDYTRDYALYNTDLDARYRFRPLENHDLAVGGSVRLYVDSSDGSDYMRLTPTGRNLQFFRGFFHDEISMLDRQLIATIGSRFEQNSQNGFSAMPTARLLWHATERTSLWGAFSYTAGTTSRLYDDVKTRLSATVDPTSGLPTVFQFTGNRNVPSEKLLAYEIGTRSEPNESFFTDVSGFYFSYSDLFSTEVGDPSLMVDPTTQTPFILLPLIADSKYRAETYGTEATANWRATNKLKFVGSYTYFTSFARGNHSTDPITESIYENLPTNVVTFRTSYDITSDLESDAIFRYVDKLKRNSIPSYGQLDLRLGWKAAPTFTLNLIGRNLLTPAHEEFKSWTVGYPASQVQRSVFVQATKTF